MWHVNIREKKIINNLKLYRKQANLTQRDLAQGAEVALRSYCYFESGERIPDVYAAKRFAKILKTEISDIFPDDF